MKVKSQESSRILSDFTATSKTKVDKEGGNGTDESAQCNERNYNSWCVRDKNSGDFRFIELSLRNSVAKVTYEFDSLYALWESIQSQQRVRGQANHGLKLMSHQATMSFFDSKPRLWDLL
ncbi:hypothetical protein JOB18_047407 [Solea senegalensis]|uniref:Uncharacterized protein n=1 Tax=Solea senegalensis TaxID=28829 RepID=A0AAV6RYP8_SOLSE|nr:hypothetical protein JOB18_047407 [Solea senegalensis]